MTTFKVFASLVITLGCFSAVAVNANELCDHVADGLFISDGLSCAGYLYCSVGYSYSGDCPSGYSFNQVDQNCDFSYNVICDLDDITTDSGLVTAPTVPTTEAVPVDPETPAPGDDTTVFVIPTAPTAVTEAPVANPCLNEKDDYFISDGATCDGYFYCHSNVGHSLTCPTGYHFNVIGQMCDFPENVQCVYV